MLESLFNKVTGLALGPLTLVKEAPTQVFPGETCEIFKNTFF